jgi:hypothetical protein
MDTALEKVNIDKMNKIIVDNETLHLLEELTGVAGSCYDWWELSQGMKDIVIGLYLLRKNSTTNQE